METRVPGGGGGPPEPQQLDRFSAPSAAAAEDWQDRDPFLPAGCGGSGGYRRNPRPGRALAKHPRGSGSGSGPPGERSPGGAISGPPAGCPAAPTRTPPAPQGRSEAPAGGLRRDPGQVPCKPRALPAPPAPPNLRGARFVVPHACRGRSPAPLGARSAPPRVCAHPPRSAGHREPTRAPRCAPVPAPGPAPLPSRRPAPRARCRTPGRAARGSAAALPPAPLGAAGRPAGSPGREEGERPAPLRPPGERRGKEGGGWDGTERPPDREPAAAAAAGRAGSRGAAGGCGPGRPAGPRPPFRQAGGSLVLRLPGNDPAERRGLERAGGPGADANYRQAADGASTAGQRDLLAGADLPSAELPLSAAGPSPAPESRLGMPSAAPPGAGVGSRLF